MDKWIKNNVLSLYFTFDKAMIKPELVPENKNNASKTPASNQFDVD